MTYPSFELFECAGYIGIYIIDDLKWTFLSLFIQEVKLGCIW